MANILDCFDFVLMQSKSLQIEKWLKVLNFLDLIVIQIQILKIYQAVKFASRNLRNFVVIDPELDQIFALI